MSHVILHVVSWLRASIKVALMSRVSEIKHETCLRYHTLIYFVLESELKGVPKNMNLFTLALKTPVLLRNLDSRPTSVLPFYLFIF